MYGGGDAGVTDRGLENTRLPERMPLYPVSAISIR